MPNTKSAERRMRNSERKNLHNRSIKSNVRRVEKDYRALLTAGKKDEAKKLLPQVHSTLDKAVKSGAELNSSDFRQPIFASRNFIPTDRQPKPYFTLRLKLIEDASSKYFVGQLTSPIVKPCHKICASI